MHAVNTFDARESLGTLREALERSARALEADLRRLDANEAEEAGSAGRRAEAERPEHVAEGGEIRQALSALLAHETTMLERVRRAEMRLRDGLYGSCTRCGRALEEWQLRAVPEAELCTSCHSDVDEP